MLISDLQGHRASQDRNVPAMVLFIEAVALPPSGCQINEIDAKSRESKPNHVNRRQINEIDAQSYHFDDFSCKSCNFDDCPLKKSLF